MLAMGSTEVTLSLSKRPAIRRFLSRLALPDSTNPYVPGSVNPLGLLLGAGVVVGLYRRKHGNFSKYDTLAAILNAWQIY
jgi:hypothetical protein